jgi:hypothetical protein
VVDNFVDNSPSPAPKRTIGVPPGRCAQKYGMEIFLRINSLHWRDAAPRPTTVTSASAGAAVELWYGAGRCFVDG